MLFLHKYPNKASRTSRLAIPATWRLRFVHGFVAVPVTGPVYADVANSERNCRMLIPQLKKESRKLRLRQVSAAFVGRNMAQCCFADACLGAPSGLMLNRDRS